MNKDFSTDIELSEITPSQIVFPEIFWIFMIWESRYDNAEWISFGEEKCSNWAKRLCELVIAVVSVEYTSVITN